MDTDDDEKETKHKPDLNFGVPKNIKKGDRMRSTNFLIL